MGRGRVSGEGQGKWGGQGKWEGQGKWGGAGLKSTSLIYTYIVLRGSIEKHQFNIHLHRPVLPIYLRLLSLSYLVIYPSSCFVMMHFYMNVIILEVI